MVHLIGSSSEMQVLVTMKDGRSCVLSGPAKGVTLLLQWEGLLAGWRI